MSVEAAVAQYRRAMVDQFEVRSSVFRTATTKESIRNGLTVTFLVNGSGTDTAVTRGVNGQIPYGNPTNSQVTATLKERHAPYELTGFNIFASQGDQMAGMRQAAMSVINREIDLECLAALSSATIDTGASATASVDMVVTAKAYLGNQGVPTQEADNMFAVITDGFLAYLMQTTEFASADYVDVKPFGGGAARRMLRWYNINWMISPQITGVATTTELCYMWHRSALGYAVSMGEDKIDVGYDSKQDTSWSRASIYHNAKILQNSGIVQMKHDGSKFALS